jgi:putative salt-induced outer membrane protein YdiY
MIGLVAMVCLACSWPAHGVETPDLRRLPPVEDEGDPLAEPVVTPPPDRWEELTERADSEPGVVDGFSVWEQKVVWQDWILPDHWKLPRGWRNTVEIGIDGSEGNSTTLTLRTGAHLKRRVDWSDLKIAINYLKSTAENVETKHNAQLEMQHDWLLGASPWSPFAKSILVYDEFRPFRFELTLNAGLGYRFIDNGATTFKARCGSGATRKFRGTDDTWEPEAMLGVDCEHMISQRQKVRATIEYYPEWSDFSLYRIRSDAAWEVLLDQETNLSLKLGVIDRYDTRDSGQNPNALDYTLLLLWKL